MNYHSHSNYKVLSAYIIRLNNDIAVVIRGSVDTSKRSFGSIEMDSCIAQLAVLIAIAPPNCQTCVIYYFMLCQTMTRESRMPIIESKIDFRDHQL
jgi:hypothetical protein